MSELQPQPVPAIDYDIAESKQNIQDILVATRELSHEGKLRLASLARELMTEEAGVNA